MNIYFRIVFEGNGNSEPDKNFVSSLLGAQYNEAVAVEDYEVAEGIMERIKKLA